MWINHLTANADDWIWKIHDFLGEIQRRSKGSVDITCLLGLTNAKRANQQIQTSAVRKYICMILTNP